MAIGAYISVPFCRAKCTFCNFASGVFAAGQMERYVEILRGEIRSSRHRAASVDGQLPLTIDSVYFGGGTPSLLSAAHLRGIFADLRDVFSLTANAEITVECAPGQIADDTLEELLQQGVNRLSFGVQSFVDRETAAVGRLHTGEQALADVARVRAHGFTDVSLDLIAGLPHQTETSWRLSLTDATASGATHLSVYMLEIDDGSRLGQELLLGGSRYHAETVPSDDQSADLYEIACEELERAGFAQYEISNFAQPGRESRHNLKYWLRQPYLGFGLDAHSMLHTTAGAVRFANTADLDLYLDPAAPSSPFPLLGSPAPDTANRRHEEHVHVDRESAFEEALFLGLRLNSGVDVEALRQSFGAPLLDRLEPALTETLSSGLLETNGRQLRLSPRGRMVSNEIFSRLLLSPAA